MRIHPGGFRVVLVGAKVSRLLPFLQSRGFLAEAFVKGGDAQARLRAAPCHVLIVELELGDMMGVELGRAARFDRHAGAVVLMDDPSRSGMIVSALARGLETFLPIPPDENVFLERLEMLLLAQWGVVVTQQQQQLMEELARAKEAATAADERVARAEAEAKEQVARAESASQAAKQDARRAGDDAKRAVDDATKQLDDAVKEARAALSAELADERRKVQQLQRETAVLRDQLTSMHLVTGAKTGVSDEGAAHSDLDDDLSALLGSTSGRPATTASKPAPASSPGRPSQRPEAKRSAVATKAEAVIRSPATTPGARESAYDLDEFETQQHTLPAQPAVVVGPPRAAAGPDVSPLASSRRPGASPSPAPIGAPPLSATAPHAATPAKENSVDRELPTLKSPRPQAVVAATRPERRPLARFDDVGAGLDGDLDAPTMQLAALPPRATVPASIFDELTPLAPEASAQADRSFKANDEQTAPGGHSISELASQLAAEEKAKKPHTARPASMAVTMKTSKVEPASLKDIADLPSLDEEVLFFEEE